MRNILYNFQLLERFFSEDSNLVLNISIFHFQSLFYI